MTETLEKRPVTHTLNIVRYTTEELADFIREEFYKELATSTTLYFQDKKAENTQIIPRVMLNKRLQRIKDIKFRINDFEQRIKECSNEEDKDVYRRANKILTTKLYYEENPSFENAEKEYKETKDLFASHSFTEFPLNKKINGIYDDFNAVVVYWDTLVTEEAVSSLENAETIEEKVAIVKKYVKITHITIRLANFSRVSICLEGKMNDKFNNPKDPQVQILPPKFANFRDLTLADCDTIANNDIAQAIQSRIDMEKENLETVAALDIKGEHYEIVQPREGESKTQFIKYVCPSTGRIYHNAVNHKYLAKSKYYKQGEPESYIKAWYSIANLFMELTDEEIARPSISC